MLEPLLSQQRKRIFQCCFPPPVLTEVVAEEFCHFGILLRPEEKSVVESKEDTTAVSQLFSNVTELILVKGGGEGSGGKYWDNCMCISQGK